MRDINTREHLIEEQLVEELSHLGIGYLSRHSELTQKSGVKDPSKLLAELVKQPTSRVRTSVIPLLLEHPEFAELVPYAVTLLHGRNRNLLMIFYTAAVILQKIHKKHLVIIQGAAFKTLPDLFSEQLSITKGLSSKNRLAQLALRHREMTGSEVNWQGTYENAVRKWLKQK
jgi:hypothetical protein